MRTLNLTEEQYDRIIWGLVIAANTSYHRGNEAEFEKFNDLEDELRKTYGEPIDD